MNHNSYIFIGFLLLKLCWITFYIDEYTHLREVFDIILIIANNKRLWKINVITLALYCLIILRKHLRLFAKGKCVIKLSLISKYIICSSFNCLSIKYHVDLLTPWRGSTYPLPRASWTIWPLFLTSHIFMALSHNCLLIISNDRKHSEICLDDFTAITLFLASRAT